MTQAESEPGHSLFTPPGSSVPATLSVQPDPPPSGRDIEVLHERLGIEGQDLLSVGSQTADGRFRGTKATAREVQSRFYASDANHWAGLNVLDPRTASKRGTRSDVVRVTSLVADLDDKPEGLPGRELIAAAIGTMAERLGTPPVAIIHSGHGQQPLWAIHPADQHRVTELQAVTRRFGTLLRMVAAQHGGAVDSTFDIARIWRIPGTVNVKIPESPVPVSVTWTDGHPLTMMQLLDALEAAGVSNVESDPQVVLSTPKNWPLADAPCPYAGAMITGWATDTPVGGRHPWLLGQAVRLHAAQRNGCLTPEQLRRGQEALRERFETVCREAIGGQERQPGLAEFDDAWTWAVDQAACLTDEEVIQNLGGKPHGHGDSFLKATERPVLTVDNEADTLGALRDRLGTGTTAGVFARGDLVVNVPRIGEEGYRPPVDGDDGPAQVRPMNAVALAATIDAMYQVRRTDRQGNSVPALFPKSVAERIVAAPEHVGGLRALRGVTHTPVMRPDWTVLDAPGYCDQTGLLLLPDRGSMSSPVPRAPSKSELETARDGLLKLIEGFPFISESDRANFLASMLAPLVRPALPRGSTLPLLVVNAPMPGSGKSLLAQILMELHGGVFRSRLPDDGAEVRKQIATVLERTTAPVIVWDNVVRTIRSADLAALLTTTKWNDRILGESRDVTQPNDRLWVVTGNNVSLGGDMARRGLWVTIDPDQPDPHTRTGFAIANLRQYVTDHRAKLLAALLTLITGWVAEGQPRSNSRSDTFAGFVAVTGAILANVQVPGVVMGDETNRAAVSTDDDEWASFLGAIYNHFGSEPFTVSALAEALAEVDRAWDPTSRATELISGLPADLSAKLHAHKGSISRSLGMWLRNRDGRWAGPYVARSTGRDSHANAVRYVVTRADVRQ